MSEYTELQETAHWAIEAIDSEGSWHDSEAWWAKDGLIAKYVAEADPHTIVALIADLGCAEEGLDVMHSCVVELRDDLAAAGKVIEKLEAALNSITGSSTIRAYGLTYMSDTGERLNSVALTDAARRKLAVARVVYDEWKERDDD